MPDQEAPPEYGSLVTPSDTGVPVDDDAEPDDAGIDHDATPEEVRNATSTADDS